MALQVIGGPSATDGISRLTTEYIVWTITSTNDFDGATVELAFAPDAITKPGASDWVAAEFIPTPGANTTSIRLLIGPEEGGKDLTPPDTAAIVYSVWTRISRGSERIVRRLGTLKVR